MASIKGHADVVRTLINHVAFKDVQCTLGDTPLHIAAKLGHTNIVTLLLESEASKEIKNHDGKMAHEVADHYEIKNLILKRKEFDEERRKQQRRQMLKQRFSLFRSSPGNVLVEDDEQDQDMIRKKNATKKREECIHQKMEEFQKQEQEKKSKLDSMNRLREQLEREEGAKLEIYMREFVPVVKPVETMVTITNMKTKETVVVAVPEKSEVVNLKRTSTVVSRSPTIVQTPVDQVVVALPVEPTIAEQPTIVEQRVEQPTHIKFNTEGTHLQKRLRYALLIGNSNYTQETGALINPVHDVKLVSEKLATVGFQTTVALDLPNKSEMEQVVEDFTNMLMDADDNLEACLFYYAGHGIQSSGENYALPIGVTIITQADIKRNCLNLNYVMSRLSESCSSKSVQILILDACRNELQTRGWKSTTRDVQQEGLCKVDAPSGTLVIFSTAPGKKALDTCDESDTNSPFAVALSKNIQKNTELYKLYLNVTADVKRMTNGDQNPYLSSSMDSEFLL